jgi:hypothetical protein
MLRAATIGLVTFALSNPALSETIKLACHFTEVRSYPSGNEVKSSGRIVLQVETENGKTMIIGNGADLSIAVGNIKVGSVVDIQDFSDAGKWDITNKTISPDQSSWLTQVVIDRNTGDFNFYRSKDGGISTDATGTCEKVKLSARKF